MVVVRTASRQQTLHFRKLFRIVGWPKHAVPRAIVPLNDYRLFLQLTIQEMSENDLKCATPGTCFDVHIDGAATEIVSINLSGLASFQRHLHDFVELEEPGKFQRILVILELNDHRLLRHTYTLM